MLEKQIYHPSLILPYFSQVKETVRPIFGSSHQAENVTRSVGSEVMAFEDEFDKGFVIKKDLETMLQKTVPIEMYTDRLLFFDTISKSADPTEKCMQIDLKCAKNGYEAGDIEVIYLIRSKYNLSEFLKKSKAISALSDCMNSRKLNHPAEP